MLIFEACERLRCAHSLTPAPPPFPERPRLPAPERAELSYEWLFDAAGEAVLVVEETSGSVVEANLAAARLLHAERAAVHRQIAD